MSLIDGAASLVHMMNLNTFTCGAFHVSDAGNVSTVAADIRSAVQGKQWMCGFPDKVVVISVADYVMMAYGAEECVDDLVEACSEVAPDSTVLVDAPAVLD